MPHKDPEKRREWRRNYDAANRQKLNEQAREYRKAHPVRYVSDEARKKQRKTKRDYQASNGPQMRRKSRHGLLPEDWARMHEAQNGRCYLCGDPLPDDPQKIHIDHDHTCCPAGKSCAACRRGMACDACNHVIGMAYDEVDRLRRIADALESAHAMVRPRIAAKSVQTELPLEV